ncbi:MAG: heavy metal-associated domain-containing protein [bacterium]|nr:heavy metal-associated domain-containing protein [bacterium]
MKKKKYNIEGLDCANCARELEEAITKIDGISSVVINFMMQKMEISYDEENEREILSNLKKVIKKEEPDVSLSEI